MGICFSLFFLSPSDNSFTKTEILGLFLSAREERRQTCQYDSRPPPCGFCTLADRQVLYEDCDLHCTTTSSSAGGIFSSHACSRLITC